MPKKKVSVYAKPTSPAHPSLQPSDKNTIHPSINLNAGFQSVNNRLQQLRLTQKGDGSRPFEAPPSRTVHPDLQTILQIPYVSPPRPRPGFRVTGGRRGPAGPPPPNSWLDRRSTERSTSECATMVGRKVPALPGYDVPEAGTLLDLALKQLARDWDFHYEYDQYYLATIPVRYKELLLHYITLHRPFAMDHQSLERLFLDEIELEGATGAVDLSRLDLSTSIGRSLTLKQLKILFTPRHKPATSAEIAEKNTDATPPSFLVPESWDTAALPQRPPFHLSPRLTTLTHLSLSCPSPNVSWLHLLNYLLPHLPSQSLTHLSLAFWPFPTLTPNSLTATSLSPAGPIQAGGSNFYSSYDSNWTEPALILRRVARATLGLQWLDLTGNWPWIQALADKGFDWSGGGMWAGLETLVVGQGWLPDCFAPSPPRNATYNEERYSPFHERIHGPFNSNIKAMESDSNSIDAPKLQPLLSPWREQYPFILTHSSGLRRTTAYEKMRSTSDGRALLEWAHNEQASLAFEQTIKTKLKQAVVFSPDVEMNEEEVGVWNTPTSSAAVARPHAIAESSVGSSRIKRKEDEHRDTTSQRRKGIRFERGWNGGWVSDALGEISKHEAAIVEAGMRIRIR